MRETGETLKLKYGQRRGRYPHRQVSTVTGRVPGAVAWVALPRPCFFLHWTAKDGPGLSENKPVARAKSAFALLHLFSSGAVNF